MLVVALMLDAAPGPLPGRLIRDIIIDRLEAALTTAPGYASCNREWPNHIPEQLFVKVGKNGRLYICRGNARRCPNARRGPYSWAANNGTGLWKASFFVCLALNTLFTNEWFLGMITIRSIFRSVAN